MNIQNNGILNAEIFYFQPQELCNALTVIPSLVRVHHTTLSGVRFNVSVSLAVSVLSYTMIF